MDEQMVRGLSEVLEYDQASPLRSQVDILRSRGARNRTLGQIAHYIDNMPNQERTSGMEYYAVLEESKPESRTYSGCCLESMTYGLYFDSVIKKKIGRDQQE